MKTAFAIWEDRIAPVFDVARLLHVVEIEAGRVVAESRVGLAGEAPAQLAPRLKEMGVATLVCGAISRSFEAALAAQGIRVTCFVAGELGAVVAAWLRGGLDSPVFAMPGCGRGGGGGGGARRRARGGRPGDGATTFPAGRAPHGAGQGSGGACICRLCGWRGPHQAGIPCSQEKCPLCGGSLTREGNSRGRP